ncbi:MAG: hypothetical protein A2499_08530 [Stygiobacter sp. RIFOXYC12_FULL_38_8]|nr:MAG: hypothetical protein A2X62_02830 [Stygiobacter sp. GWC2_38_9]OGV06495.1 MAG: hypothetical protein A2299_02200 [Stygiobacter sp. RIFOXYB2_FULL_37_11]OGV10563.1 MAG: hypothetical protein A2237_18695 [Stygiobacter sp. RIFOXYA2_FULL_38_8]OGV13244.1 MAG: hypothetical protein A2440_13020 [Stygiobacter sp. RIFOXYC2_FULL_38_25]OGV25759.1 MAG: hypothetical protein A2499_08530 [Stygiobacter sp. RIFOXYC12_FULL_38_8]OGV83290.1 MAG: hypothetical protein A2X65_16575 [Stygiobacter sp. GWF2_38_21]RJQ
MEHLKHIKPAEKYSEPLSIREKISSLEKEVLLHDSSISELNDRLAPELKKLNNLNVSFHLGESSPDEIETQKKKVQKLQAEYSDLIKEHKLETKAKREAITILNARYTEALNVAKERRLLDLREAVSNYREKNLSTLIDAMKILHDLNEADIIYIRETGKAKNFITFHENNIPNALHHLSFLFKELEQRTWAELEGILYNNAKNRFYYDNL